MAKYDENIIKVRKKSKPLILNFLKKKPKTIEQIYNKTSNAFPEICDNSIICQCGSTNRKIPEWKHQVRWALQDLKYHSQITFDKEQRMYSIK